MIIIRERKLTYIHESKFILNMGLLLAKNDKIVTSLKIFKEENILIFLLQMLFMKRNDFFNRGSLENKFFYKAYW